jgi:hypothetical protein
MMVNFILGMIDTMSPTSLLLILSKVEKWQVSQASKGIKQSIEHIKSGHPLGFFPAGAVSKTKVRNFRMEVEDREWQEPVLKLIKKSKYL